MWLAFALWLAWVSSRIRAPVVALNRRWRAWNWRPGERVHDTVTPTARVREVGANSNQQGLHMVTRREPPLSKCTFGAKLPWLGAQFGECVLRSGQVRGGGGGATRTRQALGAREARACVLERSDDVGAWLECDLEPAVQLAVGREDPAAAGRRGDRRRPARAIRLILEHGELVGRCRRVAGAEQRLDEIRCSMRLDGCVAPPVRSLLPTNLAEVGCGGGVVTATELEQAE